MREVLATSWPVKIYIAGDTTDAERVCRHYCMEVGGCVTVTPTEYVYTGGQESGVIIGFINYPRFPATCDEIESKAKALGLRLMKELCQTSFTVETPTRTLWFNNRPDQQ